MTALPFTWELLILQLEARTLLQMRDHTVPFRTFVFRQNSLRILVAVEVVKAIDRSDREPDAESNKPGYKSWIRD